MFIEDDLHLSVIESNTTSKMPQEQSRLPQNRPTRCKAQRSDRCQNNGIICIGRAEGDEAIEVLGKMGQSCCAFESNQIESMC